MIEMFDLAGNDPQLRFSPYCWRVRMALAHKGLEPRTIPWRFHEKAKLPGAPANQLVPVLVDRGQIVAGSTAIAFHLENVHSNGPSLFGGTGGEAHAIFIVAWADTVLVPALFPVLAPIILPLLHPADQGYFRETREKRLGMTLEQTRAKRDGYLVQLRAALKPLRQALTTQPFLGGAEPSYADYAVFGCFQWARCAGVADVLADDDKLQPWWETMLDSFDGLAGNAPTSMGVAA